MHRRTRRLGHASVRCWCGACPVSDCVVDLTAALPLRAAGRCPRVADVAEALDAVEFLATMLTEHGPLEEDDIAQRFQDSGVADPDDVLDVLLDETSSQARQLLDDRWVWLPTVLQGRVFTHRLGADELTHDLLTVTPDLDPITALCEHDQYQQLADGSPARVVLAGLDGELLESRSVPPHVVDPLGALVLPPGTFGALGAAEGDVVGVRLSPQGLTVERVDASTLGGGDAVGARLAATIESDEPVYFDAAVWSACVEDPALFSTPLPPLSEIAEGQGLIHYDDMLAPNGFDPAVWRFDLECQMLVTRHGIDPDEAFALNTLISFYDQMSLLLVESDGAEELPADAFGVADAGTTPPEDKPLVDVVSELGAELADPRLAELFLEETVDTGRAGAAALGLFAEVMEPKVLRSARVAFRWLRGKALERIGDIEAAERELLTAESMNTNWPLPLFDLARFASDRGDAERGLALLHRAGADPDDTLVRILQQHRVQPRPDLGRNEPCWCGSGRKYKKCHLGHEQLPLSDRVRWLYMKAFQHALLTGWRDLLEEVTDERDRYTDGDAPADPLPLDVVLFEGGAFADFLAVRGHLLPDDERLLAEQWLLVDRSVFEVDQVQRGVSVTVRDVRTGDIHEVAEKVASRQLKRGQLICARPVPAGDTMQFFGGLEPLGLHERDPLIDLLDSEPDPVELVAFLSRRFAPPTMTNTEGDPLAICEAVIRVSDSTLLEAALDDTYDRVDGEEPPQWFEHVTTHGMPRIRATLVLDGDTLRVDANSDNRMDRVLAALRRLDPAMSVLDDARRPIHDARQVAELAKQFPPAGENTLRPDEPEMAAFMDEFIRDYEATWLDQPIPALDGHTPRQAADDPTRRGDLIKLLNSFPTGAAARGGMNTDRLRAALGLH